MQSSLLITSHQDFFFFLKKGQKLGIHNFGTMSQNSDASEKIELLDPAASSKKHLTSTSSLQAFWEVCF